MKNEAFTNLSGPHFDDEQTLLSARQVVPLERIETKIRRRRQWFLGGAFAAAMMLGAASALLASYFKLRNVNNAATQVPQVELTTTTPETVETAVEPVTVANLEEEEPLVADEEEPKKEPVTRRRTMAPSVSFVWRVTAPRPSYPRALRATSTPTACARCRLAEGSS